MSTAQALAAHGKAHRKKRHEEHEEHENHERWLITYADMITLLMVLFIVLFAIGQTDKAKFEELRAGLQESFGTGTPNLLDTGGGLLGAGAGIEQLRPSEAADALADRDSARQAIAVDQASLQETAEVLDAQLAAAGVGGNVDLRIDRRGLVVTIITDQVLFEPGSDQILPAGADILASVAGALAGLPNEITVEGHTDDLPISGRFASNWELSTSRATSVLRQLLATAAVDPARVAAGGYAEQRPIADNATAEGRAANRRVEIVVHSQVTTDELVDQVAGTNSPPTTVTAVGDPIPEVDHVQEEER
jgi:chemotaxis protein MotB